MEEGRALFDASAYMLFEASGDSESQYLGGGGALEPDSDAAEDDAQSCSYGSLLFSDSARLRDEVDAEDSRRGDFDEFSGEEKEEDGGGGGVSEEDDGVVDQRRGGRGNPAAAAAVDKEKPMKSNGCEGSNVKMMNEGEGDKLFWEACLAS
ncbi:hypothetical protein ABFS82_04G022000 [Erythranthe guttata]|uniref:uncharacterized protein LOC105957890 n=1 Tax=Erythranthe guttata TaxID=4155 RepID=UPI00064D8709|nr:PREDICTED: uncharacterized protein LOC105957890 [Erythranthe guttata]|eukprot:XP_012837323.1 PREDICTED: uncharacterized protein LOC105957890 [Erythranthe guttata]